MPVLVILNRVDLMTFSPCRSSAVGCVALAATAFGQSFDYSDFSSTAGLQLGGDAAQVGSTILLTPQAAQQRGACVYDTAVAVAGGFRTQFRFRIDGGGSGTGADGFTFIIHNDVLGPAAIGGFGSALGYGPIGAHPAITNGLVVEFDTWDENNGDLSDNEISVHSDGMLPMDHFEGSSLGRTPAPVDMSDGNEHTVLIEYDGSALHVFMDNLSAPALSVPYSFEDGANLLFGGSVGGLGLINGSDAYVGFTASSGGISEDHLILDWSWDSGVGTSYCTAVTNSTGGAAETTGYGSTSIADNSLVLVSRPVPSQPGIFFYGPQQIQLAFGNGFRCVGGTVGRLDVVSGVNGAMHDDLDITAPPSAATTITAGSTWNFQCWFRDPAAGGASFNLSNGLEVMFAP